MFTRIAIVCTLMACASSAAAQSIIVIGDSIMDWNEDNSVPAQLARELGVRVDDRSVAGAQVSAGFWGQLQGLDIRQQLDGDNPDILVMTGGGNDLGEACGCSTGCAREVDVLLTPDGRGELGAFLDEVTAKGTDVFYLGYADPPLGGNEFSGCVPHFKTLAERLSQIEGVTFVPVTAHIDSNDLSFYDPDRLHPSAKGSATMARLLADAINGQ